MEGMEIVGHKLRPLGTPEPLRIYAVSRTTNSAQVYYRTVVPFKTAEEMGLCEYLIDDQETLSKVARVIKFSNADFHHYSLLVDKNIIKRIREFRSTSPGWDKFRKRILRSPLVLYDSDDDLESVDPYNPRFGSLGTRLPDGPYLRRGAWVNLQAGEGEDHYPVWKDGVIYAEGEQVDWVRNRKRLELFKASVRLADGAVATTPNLASVFRGYGAQNVYVFPNSIRFNDYPEIKLERDTKAIKILWQGGWSHFRDWYPLREALSRVSLRYDHVKFLIWGQQYNWVHEAIPPTRRQHIQWMPHDAYILKLSTIDHDINLAPIADNRFNRCKSAIKWYESSAIYRPAASLLQDVTAYNEATDRVNCLKFKDSAEFEERLCELIEDEKLRVELAENAKQWVKENRDARVTVPRYIEWMRSLIK